MNKKITLLALVLVAVMLIVPVMGVSAKNPEKSAQKVPAFFVALNTVNNEADAKILIDGNGVTHVWGAERTADATIKIDNGPPIFGKVLVNLDSKTYPDTSTIQRYRKMTITFDPQTNLPEGGVLVGTLTWKAVLADFGATFESHGILHGSGGLEGYTLHVDKNVGESPTHWWLIR